MILAPIFELVVYIGRCGGRNETEKVIADGGEEVEDMCIVPVVYEQAVKRFVLIGLEKSQSVCPRDVPFKIS